MALLTGKSPTEIEETWSELDVNWVLMVHRAQNDVRLDIAIKNKISFSDVPPPTSLVLLKDE